MTRDVFDRIDGILDVLKSCADEVVLRGAAARSFLAAVQSPSEMPEGRILVGRRSGVAQWHQLPPAEGHALNRDWYMEHDLTMN